MSTYGAGSEPSTTDRPSPPAAPLSLGRWLRRLTIILALGLGLVLWRDGRLFPRDREIGWLTPDDRSHVRRIEIQILSPERDVLKREQFFFPKGAPPYLLQTVALKNGDYQAMIFIEREGEIVPQFSERPIRVSSADVFTFPLVDSKVTPHSNGSSLTR